MEMQAAPNFGRTDSIVIPFPGQPTESPASSPADNLPDVQRTEAGRTYTFKQVAELLGCGDESTLRNRYWKQKVEPAFRHCPTPLQSIAKYDRNGNPVYRLNDVAIEVFQAFLVAKTEGREDEFLMAARQQYPAPAVPHVASAEDVPLSQTEVLPRSEGASEEAGDRPGEVVVYERSSALVQLLNSRISPKAPQVPEQNTTFLQVRDRLNQLEQRTLHTRSQVLHTAQSHSDTAESLEVLEDLELIERVRAKAQRHFQLEQDVYREELDLLKQQTVLGK